MAFRHLTSQLYSSKIILRNWSLKPKAAYKNAQQATSCMFNIQTPHG